MKTREDVEKLKHGWYRDPCWDLYDTEGYEEYREELKQYQEQCEKQWEERRLRATEKEKKEAEKLGCSWEAYKLLENIQDTQSRLYEAINYLINDEPGLAKSALRGGT